MFPTYQQLGFVGRQTEKRPNESRLKADLFDRNENNPFKTNSVKRDHSARR